MHYIIIINEKKFKSFISWNNLFENVVFPYFDNLLKNLEFIGLNDKQHQTS